jgi:hypothetical protein
VRRSLVVTDESARHPFRMSLPPHVCSSSVPVNESGWRRQLTRRDWRDIIATYSASFIAVTLFIA